MLSTAIIGTRQGARVDADLRGLEVRDHGLPGAKRIACIQLRTVSGTSRPALRMF